MRNLCVLAVAALSLVGFSRGVAAGPHDGAVWVWEDTFDTYATGNLGDVSAGVWGGGTEFQAVSYTHLTLPTTPYV